MQVVEVRILEVALLVWVETAAAVLEEILLA
jgi:hypothetical protein